MAPVLEMRHCEARYSSSLSYWQANQKVQPGVLIFNIRKCISSRLEGETEIHPIGEGYVVDNEINAVTDKYSWVVIDEKTSLKVKKGTMGKVDASGINMPTWKDFECGH